MFANVIDAIFIGPAPQVDRTWVDGLIVSTIDSFDLGLETAIIDANDTYPVERYCSIEVAKDGHARWVAKAKSLQVITRLGHPDLGIGPDEVTIVRGRQP